MNLKNIRLPLWLAGILLFTGFLSMLTAPVSFVQLGWSVLLLLAGYLLFRANRKEKKTPQSQRPLDASDDADKLIQFSAPLLSPLWLLLAIAQLWLVLRLFGITW